MPKLEIYIRKMVIVRAKEGYSQRKIAANLKISRRAVQNIIKKYKNFKTVEDLPRSGRKRSYTDRDLRNLIRLSQVNPFLTARELRDQWKNVSIETVKGLLRKKKLFGHIAARFPFLSKKQIKKRMEWAVQYGTWTNDQWSKLIFSDECSIQLKPTRRVYVRRISGQRYSKSYTIKTVKQGGKSFMVWGAIKSNGARKLVNFLKNADSIEYQRVLKEGLIPFYNTDEIFQHDGAPCHRSKSTENFLLSNNICYITDWPAQSPDLNVIENMWAELKKRVAAHKISNIAALRKICFEEWLKIPNDYVINLYRSIPQRLLSVRKSKGLNTPY